MIVCPRPAARYVWERWPRYFAAFRRELVLEEVANRAGAPAPQLLAMGLLVRFDVLADDFEERICPVLRHDFANQR